jgi:hypothetical protein
MSHDDPCHFYQEKETQQKKHWRRNLGPSFYFLDPGVPNEAGE